MTHLNSLPPVASLPPVQRDDGKKVSENGTYPENPQMSPKKGPFQKESI